MRVLYFDIDGVLLSYDDEQRPLLAGGALEGRLKALSFERLVCVSGWSDLFNEPVIRNSPEAQKRRIHCMLSSIFLDETWFLDHLEIAFDTDHRYQHIDTALDWY